MWKAVKVKVGKKVLDADFNGVDLENLPNLNVELGESINVDGKDLKILSKILTKDNLFNLKLAGASPKLEKSEDNGDKQIKG